MSMQDAAELAKFCKHMPCKVNIIEYNPISFANFTNAGEDKIEAFAEYLRDQGVITNIRRSRGKDIDAACGQLAIKEKSESANSSWTEPLSNDLLVRPSASALAAKTDIVLHYRPFSISLHEIAGRLPGRFCFFIIS